jgi:hypothetical protein
VTLIDPELTAEGLDELEQFMLTQRLDELFQLAKDEKAKRHAEWARNYMLTYNRSSGSNTRPGSGVRDSEIYPIIRNRIAWMTDQKVSFDVYPAVDPQSQFAEYEQGIGHHMELVLGSNWQVQSWYRQQVLMLWDAAICGAGILKAVWDSGLDGGIGNVAMLRRDPWSIYPDPNATSMDDLAYLFEVKRMSIEEIERNFPETSQALINDAAAFGDSGDLPTRPKPGGPQANRMVVPGNIPGNPGTAWGKPGQGTQTSDSVLENGVNVYECWIRENVEFERETTDPLLGQTERVVTDEWRVVVFSGRHVLLDTTATELWQHNHHPYARYVDDETGEFWPVPIVSYLAPCQVAIDRLLAAMQSNAELCGNPIFMDVAGSGLNRTQMINRAGLRLTLDQGIAANGQGVKPTWLTPPQFSLDAMQLINLWKSIMENISGLSGPQKGQTPQGRQAQQTIQAAQEAGFVSIRLSQRNQETAFAKIGMLLCHLIAQNYTEPRVVAIVGDKGSTTSLLLAARHFYSPSRNPETGKYDLTPMAFSLNVNAGSDRPTSRQARIAEVDALFAMKAVDQQTVLQVHQFADWQDIVKRMQDAAMALAAAQHNGAQGGGGGPGGGGAKGGGPHFEGPGSGTHEH